MPFVRSRSGQIGAADPTAALIESWSSQGVIAHVNPSLRPLVELLARAAFAELRQHPLQHGAESKGRVQGEERGIDQTLVACRSIAKDG